MVVWKELASAKDGIKLLIKSLKFITGKKFLSMVL